MSHNPKFNAGDVVQLKSGGPKMTVHQYDTEPMSDNLTSVVLCKWFDNNTNLQKEWFEEDSLERVEA